MTDVEATIRAYQYSVSGASTLAARCRNVQGAAITAEVYANGGSLQLATVTSDATRAVGPTIARVAKNLQTIAGTLTSWAAAADTYAGEVRTLASRAETHRLEITRNQRSLAVAEDEPRVTQGDAIAYGYRTQALEREIASDQAALTGLLASLEEQAQQLARALQGGQNPVDRRAKGTLRMIGSTTQQLDAKGDDDWLWQLLRMGVDDKTSVRLRLVDPAALLSSDEDGNPVSRLPT